MFLLSALRGSSTFEVSENRFFLCISNLDVTRNVPCEGFDRIHVNFTRLCGSLNAFLQKSCFLNVLTKARLEYLEHLVFLVL